MSLLPEQITPEVLGAIADRVAAILAARRPERDLAGEIAAYLADHRPETVREIAFGIGARETTVGLTLAADNRFQRAYFAPGRSPKAHCWELAAPTTPTPPKPGRGDGASA